MTSQQTTTTTLLLWVSNQPGDSDHTYHYIQAAAWNPPAGVTLTNTPTTQELSGDDPEAVFAAYQSLAAIVAELGHGDDIDGDPIEGEADLTACLPGAADDHVCTARRSWLRCTSREARSYAEWVR